MPRPSLGTWPIFGRRAALTGSVSLLAFGAAAAPAAPSSCASLPPPPVTPKHPVRTTRFGHTLVDDFAWLHPPHWFSELQHPERLDSAIRMHLLRENLYCDTVMRPTNALQAKLMREIAARSPGNADPPPQPDGAWSYWSEMPPGNQFPSFLRRPRDGGPAQLLADFDQIARGQRYFRLSSLSGPTHSPDGKLFAWAVDETGDEMFRLYVRDLATGKLVGPPVEHCFGDWVFSPDSQWLFWLLRDEQSHPTKVLRRPAYGGADTLIYQEHDPAFFITLARAASNGFLFINVLNASATETWLIPGADPTAAPRITQPRRDGLHYDLEHWYTQDGRDQFVVRTDANGAVDFKLMLADGTDLSERGWRPWITPPPGRAITAIRAFRDDLARVEWIDANPWLVTVGRDGGQTRRVGCEDAAYGLELDMLSEYDSALVRFSCQSPRRPITWWTIDMRSGRRALLGQQKVPGFNPRNYEVRRLEARAPDGASVPISLLMRGSTALDGNAPCILFGYGAYGFTLIPEFSVSRLSLADRGWIVAIAHVRGGGERGMGWFEQTLKAGKKKTITDYIACAEHLAGSGYTRAGRIVGHSFSAGGILIGGAINLRPELFGGAIGEVPFVDVLNTMLDATNPLVASALPIWGNPSEPAMFEAILSYDPYQNVSPRRYPAVLATAGLLDDRVGFWEPAKWIAKLRQFSTSGKPVMLRTDMYAGHQGRAGLDRELCRDALFWAFAILAVSGRWNCG